MKKTLACSLSLLQLISSVSAQGRNIALNQTTSQFQTLDFSDFLWTADKAVDNCTLQDDPDNQKCCSSSLGTSANFWRVDFDMPYNVSHIVVFGRDSSASGQTKDFRVDIVSDTGLREQIYDNACCLYENGIFTIQVMNKLVSSVIITRPTENLLTLCEVQVFEVVPVSSTAATVVTSSAGPVTATNPGQSTSNIPSTPSTSVTSMAQSSSTTMTSNGNPNQTTGMPNSASRLTGYSERIMLVLIAGFFVLTRW